MSYKLIVQPETETKKVKREEFMKLCGAWESDKSTEEIVAEIRVAKKFKERDLAL